MNIYSPMNLVRLAQTYVEKGGGEEMELKSHATFRQLCQLEICHQLSVPYVTWKQRNLLNRNSLNFTMFTSGLRKGLWKRQIEHFSFYEYPPVFIL